MLYYKIFTVVMLVVLAVRILFLMNKRDKLARQVVDLTLANGVLHNALVDHIADRLGGKMVVDMSSFKNDVWSGSGTIVYDDDCYCISTPCREADCMCPQHKKPEHTDEVEPELDVPSFMKEPASDHWIEGMGYVKWVEGVGHVPVAGQPDTDAKVLPFTRLTSSDDI